MIPHAFALVVVLWCVVVIVVVDVDLKSNSLVIVCIDMICHLTNISFHPMINVGSLLDDL